MEFEQNSRTYGKTMEFSFCWEKVRAFITSGLRNVVLMFVASVITSLGLALSTSRDTASLGRVNTCQAVYIVRPLSRLR